MSWLDLQTESLNAEERLLLIFLLGYPRPAVVAEGDTLWKWLIIQQPAFGTASAKEAGLWGGVFLSYPF